MIRIALALLLFASPCAAAGGPKLMFSGGVCIPSGHTVSSINGISSLVQSGTTDTGTQTVTMHCGTITANASCEGEDVFSSNANVYLVVDGSVRATLHCDRQDVKSSTLSWLVSNTGSHTVRVYGTKAGADLFSAGTFSIPVP